MAAGALPSPQPTRPQPPTDAADEPKPVELLPSQHQTRHPLWPRMVRTGDAPPLTPAEVRRLVKAATTHGRRLMCGARMVLHMAGSPWHGRPKHFADRTHAARRWSRRIVGRAVGVRQLMAVVEALRPIVAQRVARAARRKARGRA